jgi:putative oxidoreductase
MADISASADRWATEWGSRALSVLRIVAALLFMEHGTAKLVGFPYNPSLPPLTLLSLEGVTGILEGFGGLLLVLGLFTRPVAFLLSGEMAVGYFMAHFPKSFFPLLSGGDPAVLYCFLFFYFFIVGGGRWSLDRLRQR